MTLITDVFPKLRTPKNIVNQISKKSPFIEPFDKQHVSGTKTVEIWTRSPLPYLLITVEAMVLEKISLTDMQSF